MLYRVIGALLIVLAAAVGAMSGGWSAALLRRVSRRPITDAALGVVGFAVLAYAQWRWTRPILLIPISAKSLLGAVLLPIAHQALRSR